MQVLAISLVVAGAALASLGVLALTGAAFTAMPRRVSFAVLATGALVVAFGALLPHFVRAGQAPHITLEREPADATPVPVPNGELRGSVVSMNGASVAGAKVVLYSSSRPPVTATSAPDGEYRFRDLPIGGPYRVAVSYAGGVFEKIVLIPSPPVSITVTVTTPSPAKLEIHAASLALVGDSRGVQAVYAATLTNSGDRAYVGGVPMPVLTGAMAVDPRSGTDRSQLAVQSGTLFSSTPVLPGSTPLSYTYVAPMPAKGTDAAIDTTFPTARFDLLLSGRLRVDTPNHASGTIRLGGRTYRRYTWRNLKPGDMIAARVSVSSPVPLIRTAAIAFGGLVAMLIVAFPLLRRRRREPMATASPVPVKQ
jgi:Carboxypeptidase regulatory-like domain